MRIALRIESARTLSFKRNKRKKEKVCPPSPPSSYDGIDATKILKALTCSIGSWILVGNLIFGQARINMKGATV